MAKVTIAPSGINGRPFKVGDLVVSKESGVVYLLASKGSLADSFYWVSFTTPIRASQPGLFPRANYDLFHGTVTLEN